MTTPFNSEENFNELIFENRNKEYGAYALRKSYGNTVTQSMIISSGCIALLVFAIFWFSQGIEKLPDLGSNTPPPIPTITTEVIITPPVKPKEKVQQADPVVPKTKNINLTPSDEPDKKIEGTNQEIVVSKNPNDKGVDSAFTAEIIVRKADPPVDNSVHDWVDQLPEFDGNIYQFIKDNLKYPQIAKENGTDGLVGLSFVIEKDGSIGEIKVLRNVRDGCTEEAIRVVKMMPKWKPGMLRGMPVRAVFNLPVKFRLK
jgi:periplasmic protein TonB